MAWFPLVSIEPQCAPVIFGARCTAASERVNIAAPIGGTAIILR